jgi:hypothetical protein
MIKITSYPINPYLAPGSKLQPDNRNNHTNWLRVAINLMMNRRKAELLKAGVNIDLFHNHDTQRGQNLCEYPKIQYQRNGNRFFATGINEGEHALEQLFADCNPVVSIDDHLTLKIGKPTTVQYQPQLEEQLHTYTLTDWLPLSDDCDKEFAELAALAEKATYLEKRLMNHLVNDFCRYLNVGIDTAKVQVTLMDIDSLTRSAVMVEENKHIRNYQPFNVTFRTNLPLPSCVCLGNKKAYGYGLVEANTGFTRV